MATIKKLLRRAVIVTPLKWTERIILWRHHPLAAPQLFILGLPRSGTTLVYQYIVHRLRVAYFTNGVGSYPKSPCAITWWQHARQGEYRSDFKSSYGQTLGAAAPHEAGEVWARWFGYDDYIRFEELSGRDVRALRQTVGCLQRIHGQAPFVNKNVKHLLRVDALRHTFPDATFLVVHRPLPDVALSVLRARHANGGDASRWWSVKPPNYEELRTLSPCQQVARQLCALEQRLEQDLRAVPRERVLHIEYEDFCKNPETLIASLQTAWGGIPFRNPGVTHFETTVNQPRTPEEEELAGLLANPGLCSR